MSTPPVVNYGVGGYGVVSTSGGGGGGGGGGGSPYIPVGGQGLSIPGLIYPSEADLKQFDGVAEFISPFTGQEEEQSFLDQHWELDLTWPEMTWEQFAPLQAFTGALHGKAGTFVWGPPLATSPQGLGTAAGAPTCVGTDLVGSNVLTLAGWTPNTTGVLLPGDFLQLGGGTLNLPSRLYQYVGVIPLTSDGGGNTSVAIFPSLREAPTAGQGVILTNPQGTFRLAENRRSAPAKKTKTFTLSLKCREAISIGSASSGGGGGVAAPTFSLAAGSYTGNQTTTITSTTAAASIIYTTDGTTPSLTNGTTVANGSALAIATSETVEAIALLSGAMSFVSSAAYVISNAGSGTTVNITYLANLLDSSGSSTATITFLTSVAEPPTGIFTRGSSDLVINVNAVPADFAVGAIVTLAGITNHPELNGLTGLILATGTNANGPYVTLGPFNLTTHPAFAIEADTGTASVGGGGATTQLVVNIEGGLPTGFTTGVEVALSGITNEPQLNGLSLAIIGTGTNANGAYVILGPLSEATYPLFSTEADTGTGSIPGD
jgi:hypothetical protein